MSGPLSTDPLVPPGADPAPAPGWLVERLHRAGGAVPFATYMQWVLHDPDHGAYGAGRLRIGPRGDFATSPSLGPDFASLLAVQLIEWLEALGPGPLVLIEAGPGEGSLAGQLAAELVRLRPDLAARTSLELLEPNPAMADRQRRQLAACPLPVRWRDPHAPGSPCPRAVLIAHEVLDALAVERLLWDGDQWRLQQVALAAGPTPGLRLAPGDPLVGAPLERLARVAAAAADPGRRAGPRPPGWCTELHPGVGPWLAQAAGLVEHGWLLVIDYALDAQRYYSPRRPDGTLMAYRDQRAHGDPLRDPGRTDLTAHLCVETLLQEAEASGWGAAAGHCLQGEALLALGLAGRLHGLQAPGADSLAQRLARREALLRLVDPAALGAFRWFAWSRGAGAAAPRPRFLHEPQPEGDESASARQD
ncbi:MAG: class I SAM-dependent methyltransferase [Prochlorococcaceae cyanobacterium]